MYNRSDIIYPENYENENETEKKYKYKRNNTFSQKLQ